MIKIWRIFWHEYKEHLTRKSYLIFTFGFPLFMLLAPLAGGIVLGLAIRTALPERDRRPIGLVDQAAFLTAEADVSDGPVEIISFSDPAQARAALAAGQVQAVYDIQPDYWQTGQIVLDYEVAPTADIDEMVSRLITAEVEAKVSAAVLNRINRGASIIHQDLSGTRSFSLENMVELGLVFLPIYFIRLGSSFMAEYMFGSIAREAHDRTMEILITSVSPLQLVIGKLVGLLAVGLTQLGTWIGAVLLLAGGLDAIFELGILTTILTWNHLGLMLSVLLAAYIMDQVLAATLAMFRVSGGAGSMMFNTINWVVGLGLIYAIYFVPRTPHAPLAVAASIFPITASIVLMIRVVVSDVPLWQIIMAQLSLWGTIVGSVFWLRWLLQRNLVAYAAPFRLREWLVRRLRVQKRTATQDRTP